MLLAGLLFGSCFCIATTPPFGHPSEGGEFDWSWMKNISLKNSGKLAPLGVRGKRRD